MARCVGCDGCSKPPDKPKNSSGHQEPGEQRQAKNHAQTSRVWCEIEIPPLGLAANFERPDQDLLWQLVTVIVRIRLRKYRSDSFPHPVTACQL